MASYRLRIPFTGRKALTIIPAETYSKRFVCNRTLADLDLDTSDHSRLKMERTAKMLLSGIEAQRRYDETSIRCGEGFGNWDGGTGYGKVVDMVDKFTSGPKERKLYIELLHFRVQNLVQLGFNWKCTSAIADDFMQKKVLSAKEAIAIIQGTIKNIVGTVPFNSPSGTSA